MNTAQQIHHSLGVADIDEILTGLKTGRYSREQAEAWIRRHMEMASERSDSQEMRDIYAGMAMQGLLAKNGVCHPNDAFGMADAMLAVRDAA